jgi:hypothetical protein
MDTTYHAVVELKRIAPDMLRQLLDQCADALGQAGLEPAALDAAGLLAALDRLPDRFVDVACDLHRLALYGYDQFVGAAARGRFPLEPGSHRIDRVARAFIEEPAVYREALARCPVSTGPVLREIVGQNVRSPSVRTSALVEVRRKLGRQVAEMGGGEVCRITPWWDRHLLCFLVQYVPSRHATYVISKEQIVTRDGYLVQCDLVVYDTLSGSLRLGALNSDIREQHRVAFGELLFEDGSWFSRARRCDFTPLRDLGVALTPTRGVQRVGLKGVDGRDLRRGEVPHSIVQAGSVSLDLHLVAGGRVRLELTKPNGISSFRGAIDRVLRGFLEERRLIEGRTGDR